MKVGKSQRVSWGGSSTCPACPPRELFQPCPTGRKPQGWPRTYWGDYIYCLGARWTVRGRAVGRVWGERSLGICYLSACLHNLVLYRQMKTRGNYNHWGSNCWICSCKFLVQMIWCLTWYRLYGYINSKPWYYIWPTVAHFVILSHNANYISCQSIICNYKGCDLTCIRDGHVSRKPFVNEALLNLSCCTITNKIAGWHSQKVSALKKIFLWPLIYLQKQITYHSNDIYLQFTSLLMRWFRDCVSVPNV